MGTRPVEEPPEAPFAGEVPFLIAGGGAAGLVAALEAADCGIEALVLERDRACRGTTAMSTGLIPAAGSLDQRAAGIEDGPARLVEDVMKKAQGRPDREVVEALAAESAPLVEWLRTRHGVPLSLVTGFTYPGHSAMRMMGTPNRTGEELMAALERAVRAAGTPIMTEARLAGVSVGADGRIAGVTIERPDGRREAIGCRALLLATSGFAGEPSLVARHLPEMRQGVFYGHPGNKGDALAIGMALGAATADLDAYQGHGGLAVGHAIPILWPVIMEGGIQVNSLGRRFSDESMGYSEQAAKVLAQPGGVAWTIFDERLHRLMMGFDDYRQALAAGAVVEAADPADLARRCRLPAAALAETLAEVAAAVESGRSCPLGRAFAPRPVLGPGWRAVKVTGALFHTQGGLEVDAEARVRRESGGLLPNLWAAGGAARGISGSGAAGYIAGNGLLAAVGLGRLAARSVARQLSASAGAS